MHQPSVTRILAVLGTALAAAASVILGPSPAFADTIGCQEYSVPVTVPDSGSYMAGQLCQPASGSNIVVVLVPGATYNSTYWNFPYDPSIYNFRQALDNAGYATMTVDRLGTGKSSKPLSITLTSQDQGTAVHEVIQALRTGQLGVKSFPTVILGGHSQGSAIAIFESATYHDEDGVLLTGIGHHVAPVSAAALLATIYPAPLDPMFAHSGLDAGYLTTKPGTREEDFDGPDTPDPGVVATDEATKDVISATEIPDFFAAALLPLSTGINVPVLLADGQDDPYFCSLGGDDCSSDASLAAGEAPYFSPAARLQTYVLRGSGHDLNLAPNTQLYQQRVISWLAQF